MNLDSVVNKTNNRWQNCWDIILILSSTTSENRTIHTPPGLHSKILVFDVLPMVPWIAARHYMGGNREGKALFSPFEVGKMPRRPFRTKKSVWTNMSWIEGGGRGHYFSLVHVFILSFYLKPCDYNIGFCYFWVKNICWFNQ